MILELRPPFYTQNSVQTMRVSLRKRAVVGFPSAMNQPCSQDAIIAAGGESAMEPLMLSNFSELALKLVGGLRNQGIRAQSFLDLFHSRWGKLAELSVGTLFRQPCSNLYPCVDIICTWKSARCILKPAGMLQKCFPAPFVGVSDTNALPGHGWSQKYTSHASMSEHISSGRTRALKNNKSQGKSLTA